MALQKVSLGFQDIRYSVQVQKESKTILHGITGLVNPGQMLCILGPSGSGKTSLIHILGKKIKSDKSKDVSGEVLCNGKGLTATEIMRISGFVSQEDVFNAELTVEETLGFAARLKLPACQRDIRVAEVVKKLQLDSCFKTHIGDDSNPYLKGISGGEKRRLAIALEMLDPNISVLVLDEPTSGLDAAAALNVCNVLRDLADSGITIATSLHQPRSSIMALFDQVMILAAGRRIFYGGVANYLPYLQKHLSCEVPPHESPYDLMLDLLNPAIEAQAVCSNVVPKEGEPLVLALADAYDRSELRDAVDRVASVRGVDWGLFQEAKVNVGWMSKFWTLLTRTFLVKSRDPNVLVTQMTTAVFMGIILGSLYYDTYGKDKAEFAFLDTQTCITMTVVMSVFLPFDVILTFPKERQVFLRERKAGLYPTTAFYFARILADVPMHIVAATIQALIVYYLARLRMGVHCFVFVNVFGVLVGASLMQMIGAICRTFEEANLVVMPVMMLAMMTSTSFIRQVPSWLEWTKSISVIGLLADVASYWEFHGASPSLVGWGNVLEEYNFRIQSADDVLETVAVLVAILLATRFVTFLGVKFLHTGRSSCAENLAD